MLGPGDRIGDWIVEKALGEGGMGAVYRCRNVLSDKVRAAVKVLKPHDMGDARKRFVREVELLASVQHPSVVRVLGCGEDEKRGLLFLAMELLEGEELTDRLKRGPLPWAEAVSYFQQLGAGLLAAHALGVVHRDIKPQNIIVCTDGTAKLLDFGIAVLQGGTKLTQGPMVPGTIAYMAPEVFGGQKPDHRADIYALGLVLWEALTGKEAFPEEGGLTPDQLVVRTMGSKLRSEAFDPGAAIPDALRELVLACTEPEPDDRLSDLEPFVEALRVTAGDPLAKIALPKRQRADGTFGFDTSGPVVPQPPPPPAKPKPKAGVAAGEPRRGGSGMVLVLAAAVLGLLVVVAVVAGATVLVGGGVSAALLMAPGAPPPAAPASAPSAGGRGSSPSTVGMPMNPTGKLPEGFPFTAPDDARFTVSMSTEQGGMLTYVVVYNTAEDSGSLATRYTRDAKKKGLAITRTDDRTSTTVLGMDDISLFSANIDWEIDKRTSADTRVTLSWIPDRR